MRLHREVASSGTRWSCCKPVVLVTLGPRPATVVGERPGGASSGDLSCRYFPGEGGSRCRGRQHHRATGSSSWRGELGPRTGMTRAPWVESPTCIVAEPGRPRGGASICPRGCGRGGALEILRAISPAGGAVAANGAVRHGRRSARRHPGTRPPFSCGVILF